MESLEQRQLFVGVTIMITGRLGGISTLTFSQASIVTPASRTKKTG
jgi:hypothetical protein